MKQRFFTNTIKSNFIKALIYNTPIPIIKTVNDSSYMIEDNVYLYKNKIIKCIKSGMVRMPEMDSGNNAFYKNGDIKITGESSYFGYVPLNGAIYRQVDNFIFGKYYPKLTEIFCSEYHYYDTETHEKLGELLRCYRDIFDINLMPYYNCVSGNYISDIIIYPEELKEKSSADYKTFKIPIKFNTNYTLAIDCNNKVSVAPVLLSNNHIINTIMGNSGNSLNDELLENNIFTFNSLSFKSPEIIGINILDKASASLLQNYEKYLYLLIQLPKENDSSVVLLEGDYRNVSSRHIYNAKEIDSLSDLQLSNIMTSRLSLLQLNDKVTYPFADRLIEYLLLAVITSRETITKNISRIQEYFPGNDYISQVWSNQLRSDVYLNYQKINLATQIDLNGFVDRDTESLMKRLG